MRIAVFGTGMVGRVLAGKLADLGHDVTIGTRDPQATLARTEPDQMGNPPFRSGGRTRRLLSRPTPALRRAPNSSSTPRPARRRWRLSRQQEPKPVEGKVVLDVANPLDFSGGFPPPSPSPTRQPGRADPATFPTARVVKSLNSVNCLVMVEPSRVPGDHQVFVAGEDESAKRTVTDLVRSFGWPAESIIDLGGVRAARATEMYMPLWLH